MSPEPSVSIARRLLLLEDKSASRSLQSGDLAREVSMREAVQLMHYVRVGWSIGSGRVLRNGQTRRTQPKTANVIRDATTQ